MAIAIGSTGCAEWLCGIPEYVSDIHIDACQAGARATHVRMRDAMIREKCGQV